MKTELKELFIESWSNMWTKDMIVFHNIFAEDHGDTCTIHENNNDFFETYFCGDSAKEILEACKFGYNPDDEYVWFAEPGVVNSDSGADNIPLKDVSLIADYFIDNLPKILDEYEDDIDWIEEMQDFYTLCKEYHYKLENNIDVNTQRLYLSSHETYPCNLELTFYLIGYNFDEGDSFITVSIDNLEREPISRKDLIDIYGYDEDFIANHLDDVDSSLAKLFVKETIESQLSDERLCQFTRDKYCKNFYISLSDLKDIEDLLDKWRPVIVE